MNHGDFRWFYFLVKRKSATRKKKTKMNTGMLDPGVSVARRSLRFLGLSDDRVRAELHRFVSCWRHGATRVLFQENDRYDERMGDLERALCSFSLHTDSHHRCKEDEGF